MIAWSHGLGVIEAAGRDVDRVGTVVALKRQLGAAMATEAADCTLDRKRDGVPDANRNSDALTLNQATNGVPVVRRQMEQWQFVSSNGMPVTS